MTTAIIFDCEFLTSDGAPTRFWCGPHDPDPVVAQVGAVKLGLEGEFPILETWQTLIKPLDRFGAPYDIDPLFTRLTGITADMIVRDGVPLAQALEDLSDFAGNATLWSWGKDELNMLAISCYITGIAPVLPASRFANVCTLMLAAGMPYDDIKTTRSNTLADYLGVDHPPLQAHQALDDALSVTYALQHVLQQGDLSAADFLGRQSSRT